MRKTKSTILEAVHETARDLHSAGVMEQVTMREFDRMCLPPVPPLEPQAIKQIRETSHVSQAVFAAMLNTSVSKFPEKEAVIYGSNRLTYKEIYSLSTATASALRKAGIQRGDRVGIFLDPSIELVLSIFATSFAGGVEL